MRYYRKPRFLFSSVVSVSSVVNQILVGVFGAEAWGLAWLKGVTAGLKQVGEIVGGFFESGIR